MAELMIAKKYIKALLEGENAGTVVNVVMMMETDYFDPAFDWILVEDDSIPIGIGAQIPIGDIPVITGTATSFEPYIMSAESGNFAISFDGTNVNLACQAYDMRWGRAELTLLCKQGRDKGTMFYGVRSGVMFGDYCVVWADANELLAKLETLIP